MTTTRTHPTTTATPRLLLLVAGVLSLALVAAGDERPRSPFGVAAALRVRDGEPVLRVNFTVPPDHE